ncbi:hypothetical protein A2U01_0062265, partial [Trifolium medium]|nr:hypothetical protein [Trifolium medium]
MWFQPPPDRSCGDRTVILLTKSTKEELASSPIELAFLMGR